MTPEQKKERAMQRAAIQLDHRTPIALEEIADSLTDIQAQLLSLNHHIAAIGRQLTRR